jgi:amino acid transporter
MFATLIFLLARAAWMKLPSAQGSFSLALPAFSILTLNVFTKMAISALGGFDGVAIFSEECQKPENDVARSVLIAAPLIAVIYILGTNSVLAYIKPADVDLAASVPQIIEAGFGATTLGRALTFTGSCAFSLAFFSR